MKTQYRFAALCFALGAALSLPAFAVETTDSPVAFEKALRPLDQVQHQVMPAVDLAALTREDATRRAQDLPPRFAAIHPGSGSRRKNWPAERFADVARSFGGPWLLVAGPADHEAVSVLAEVEGAVIARELAPRALASLLSRAGVYLGNDSGVTHLAAAAGAPTVALFGVTDPRTWAPIGPRVRVVDCGSAMDGASVDTVTAAVELTVYRPA